MISDVFNKSGRIKHYQDQGNHTHPASKGDQQMLPFEGKLKADIFEMSNRDSSVYECQGHCNPGWSLEIDFRIRQFVRERKF